MLDVMKIATGKVIGGKVIVEGAEFEEGASVTVLARDDEGGVTLTPEEEAELVEYLNFIRTRKRPSDKTGR
jgi:hypothetical protein